MATQTASSIILQLREELAGHTSGVVFDALTTRFRRAGIDASTEELERVALDISRVRR